jgi:hypothetical protein
LERIGRFTLFCMAGIAIAAALLEIGKVALQ